MSPSAGSSSGGTASMLDAGGDANSNSDPLGGSGPLGGSTAMTGGGSPMTGGASPGGQAGGGATSLPVSSDCNPTGTWTVVYSTNTGGSGGGSSLPLSPDTVVVTGDPVTGLQADFGRGPRHDGCAGTETGPLGTYSTAATLSGPCLLALAEGSSNVICSEVHDNRRTVELAIVGDQATGTATEKTGCCNEPTRRYDVTATPSP